MCNESRAGRCRNHLARNWEDTMHLPCLELKLGAARHPFIPGYGIYGSHSKELRLARSKDTSNVPLVDYRHVPRRMLIALATDPGLSVSEKSVTSYLG
jgi:hypothetical protein